MNEAEQQLVVVAMLALAMAALLAYMARLWTALQRHLRLATR